MLYIAKFTNCQFSKHSQIFSEFSTSFKDVEFHGLVYLLFKHETDRQRGSKFV